MYRTTKRLNETGSISDRKRSGRIRSRRTASVIKKVRERIRRNPRQSQNKLARDLKMSQSTAHRIIREDLSLRPYKKRKVYGLTELQKKRFKRSKELLAGTVEKI